jgi:TonB-linked SusC/RagA family outer membrane protein
VLPDFIYYSGAANNGVPILTGNPGVDPSKYSLTFANLGEPGYSPYIIVPANKNGTNWYKEITRNAPIQSHNLSFNGMGEGSRFLFSVNYFNQQAITQYQFFKRITARLNSEFTVFKGVRVGENIQVLGSSANTPGQGTGGGGNNNQEASVIAQTFRPMSIIPVYTIRNGDFAGTLGGSGFGTWGNAKNPLAVLYRAQNDRQNSTNIFGNVYAEVDFTRHITARTSFGGSINTGHNYAYPFIEYEHTENNANTTFNESFIQNKNWIWTNQINYKNEFGTKHTISAFVGQEAKSATGRQIIGAATGFFNYTNINFINLSNGLTQNLGGSQIFVPQNILSYFAKADYSYDGKYLVTALIRRDGSSKFVDPNKYGNFPAFGLGWRISEEEFMKSTNWINDLKIRGSWGKSGNQSAANADNAFTTFGSNRQSSWYDISGNNAPVEGFSLARLGNVLSSWENNENFNIGIDATLFHGSTDVVFDFYKRKTNGLLYNPEYQAIAGSAPAAFSNVGSMENTGIDLAITNKQNITKQIKLTSTLTFTTYKNKVTAVADGLDFFDFNSPANESNRIGGNATRNIVGEAFNSYFGYQVIGIFQTAAEATGWNQPDAAKGRLKFADINGDKKIDASDRTIIGNPTPEFSYGLNLNLEYKAFDISAFFYGVAGKDAFNFTRWWTDFAGGFPGGRSKRALYESWLPDGTRPNATTPMAEVNNNTSNANVVSSYYVEKASYFRMRNLQIGYSLPASLTSKAKISRARIYIQGTNLFTITKYSGLDPEITSNANQAAGVDVGSFPLVRQFIIGANINF